MAGQASADVVVIGGGIIGCWTALRLARRGLEVTVVEKAEIAHQGSGRNRGNVRVQLREPEERELIDRSLVLWQQLEEEARTTVEYRVTGNLLVGYDPGLTEDFRIEVQRHRDLGYDAHLVEGASLRELVPEISPDIASGFLTTQDGHVNGQLATWEVASQARAAGVRFLRGVEAHGIVAAAGKAIAVRTGEGDIAAGRILVAAAGESRRLVQALGIELPITLALHQILVTEKLPFITGPYLRCAAPRVSFCQTASGSLLLGLGPARDIAAEETPAVEPRKIEAIMRETVRLVPFLQRARVVRSWPGLFDLTPDGRAMVGPAGEIEGLWIAAGFCGHGMAISPALTESLASAIAGEIPAISLAPFDVNRFRNGVVVEEEQQGASRVSHLGNLVAPPVH